MPPRLKIRPAIRPVGQYTLQLATLATMLLPSFFLLVGSVVISGKPPHIVVLVADDLGWNDVSWHNSKV